MKKITSGILIILMMVVSFRLGQHQSLNSSAKNVAKLDYSAANAVWEVIDKDYLRSDDVEQDKLKYGLAKGLVNSLGDIHSSFLDPNEARAFIQGLQGDLEGIGAELKLRDGIVEIVSPLPNSPAEQAGLRPGDVITRVDGEHLGIIENLFDVVMKIRGPKGTDVTLTILSEDSVEQKEVTITRDSIHIEAVEWEEITQNGQQIAHVKLATFSEQVGEELGNVIRQVNTSGIDKMILDLRFNGGGYLDGAVDVSSYFLDSSVPVVHVKSSDGKDTRNTQRQSVSFSGDLVVLINDSSASASEIVAGAIQDYERGTVVGTTSFGKGSVQEVHPFYDESLMRITIAEWLTPKERSIEGQGIEPDEIIELDFDEFLEGVDNQKQAAIDVLTR